MVHVDQWNSKQFYRFLSMKTEEWIDDIIAELLAKVNFYSNDNGFIIFEKNFILTNLINFLTAFACVRETLILFTWRSTSPGIGRVQDEPIPGLTSLIVHGKPEEK